MAASVGSGSLGVPLSFPHNTSAMIIFTSLLFPTILLRESTLLCCGFHYIRELNLLHILRSMEFVCMFSESFSLPKMPPIPFPGRGSGAPDCIIVLRNSPVVEAAFGAFPACHSPSSRKLFVRVSAIIRFFRHAARKRNEYSLSRR